MILRIFRSYIVTLTHRTESRLFDHTNSLLFNMTNAACTDAFLPRSQFQETPAEDLTEIDTKVRFSKQSLNDLFFIWFTDKKSIQTSMRGLMAARVGWIETIRSYFFLRCGPNSKVHRIKCTCTGMIAVCNAVFRLTISHCFLAGDIRDQVAKLKF